MADARVAEVRRLIDGLRRDRRQHPHRGRGEYSGRAREVAGAIADMIESGRARMLTAQYARACRAAPPDAKQLAAWLVRARLDGPGWPDIELADFADALGQAGLDEVVRRRGGTALLGSELRVSPPGLASCRSRSSCRTDQLTGPWTAVRIRRPR